MPKRYPLTQEVTENLPEIRKRDYRRNNPSWIKKSSDIINRIKQDMEFILQVELPIDRPGFDEKCYLCSSPDRDTFEKIQRFYRQSGTRFLKIYLQEQYSKKIDESELNTHFISHLGIIDLDRIPDGLKRFTSEKDRHLCEIVVLSKLIQSRGDAPDMVIAILFNYILEAKAIYEDIKQSVKEFEKEMKVKQKKKNESLASGSTEYPEPTSEISGGQSNSGVSDAGKDVAKQALQAVMSGDANRAKLMLALGDINTTICSLSANINKMYETKLEALKLSRTIAKENDKLRKEIEKKMQEDVQGYIKDLLLKLPEDIRKKVVAVIENKEISNVKVEDGVLTVENIDGKDIIPKDMDEEKDVEDEDKEENE